MTLFYRKAREYLAYRSAAKDSFWFRLLRKHSIPPGEVRWSPSRNCPLLSSFSLHLDRPEKAFLLERYELLKKLAAHRSLSFSEEEGEVILTIDGITFLLETAQEIVILHEVFNESIYNILLDEGTTVIDIGFNMGTSSLFLAARKEVRRVYAFEPLRPTFDKGQRNLRLNPELGKKIEVQPFGLSDADGEVTVKYSYRKKGNVSLTHEPRKLGSDFTEERAPLREAAKVLSPILSSASGPVCMKIDCEGGEYDIMRNLEAGGCLSRIDVLMIEFHYSGPDELTGRLRKHGFFCLVMGEKYETGMIYAWRSCPVHHSGSALES